jgi:hypothetical protein
MAALEKAKAYARQNAGSAAASRTSRQKRTAAGIVAAVLRHQAVVCISGGMELVAGSRGIAARQHAWLSKLVWRGRKLTICLLDFGRLSAGAMTWALTNISALGESISNPGYIMFF